MDVIRLNRFIQDLLTRCSILRSKSVCFVCYGDCVVLHFHWRCGGRIIAFSHSFPKIESDRIGISATLPYGAPFRIPLTFNEALSQRLMPHWREIEEKNIIKGVYSQRWGQVLWGEQVYQKDLI